MKRKELMNDFRIYMGKRNKAINRVNNSDDLRQAIENMINAEDSNVIDILLKYV